VANSVHNDNSDFTGHAAGQTPIVLARLPRVGAMPSVPANPPAIQAVPPPEVLPQLELRTEIEQRTRLHLADTPAHDQAPTTSHFADRGHAVERKPSVRLPSPAPVLREDALAKPPAAAVEPITFSEPILFSEKVFRLHAQLAPHAGLIVALALIASAGLLYWMIVGPTQAPMPLNFDSSSEIYGPELRGEGFGVSANIVPEFSANTSQADQTASSSSQWTEVPLPDPTVTESHHQLAQSETKHSALPELPSVDESHYPTTDHHQALDFAKLNPPSSDMPQPFPEPKPLSEPKSLSEIARSPETSSITR